MRREEQAITDPAAIEEMLRSELVCRIALHDDPYPYVVPLHFVYDAGSIYFHSARLGRKIELMEKNRHVCFEVDHLEAIVPGDAACSWSARYRSVIGEGVAGLVPEEERSRVLGLLMKKYGGRGDYTFTKEGLQGVAVVRIDIRAMTAKAG
jgi:nitroimidazol reductase NimA-like FMN-containing flavoprotein (pyridoxamine 5'-phosphate oxidase superfamily)